MQSLPYGSQFSPTWNLGSLLGLSQVRVFSQVPLLELNYTWSHNPPTSCRAVTPNWYLIHTILKFHLQSRWIAGACHCTWRYIVLSMHNYALFCQCIIMIRRACYFKLSRTFFLTRTIKFPSLSDYFSFFVIFLRPVFFVLNLSLLWSLQNSEQNFCDGNVFNEVQT